MKRLRIKSYSNGSAGLNNLIQKIRETLPDANVLKIKSVGSRYRYRDGDVVLNWGTNHDLPYPTINNPLSVYKASNKIYTLHELTESGMIDHIPEWSFNKSDAISWYQEDPTQTVYCRTLTRASQGRGIVVANSVDQLVDAPLYTKKCNRQKEVRIHVFNGQVIDYAQKKKISEERCIEEGITISNDVRNLSNGWIFCREGVQISEEAQGIAVMAVGALGLDFGAVDMAISRRHGVRILEVNTAPGLEGTTVDRYAEAVIRLIE